MMVKDVVVLKEAADDLEDDTAYVIAVLPMRRDPTWMIILFARKNRSMRLLSRGLKPEDPEAASQDL